MRRFFGTTLLALLVVAGCAGEKTATDTTPGSPAPVSGPTIVVGSANFTESIILESIYAQALKAKGYKVAERPNIGAREVYFRALQSGAINFFPEYTGSALNYLTKQTDAAKPDAQETYDLLVAELKKVKLTAYAMAEAEDKDGIVTNKETADKHNLEKVSDLKPHAGMLVMGGPPECRTRIACLKGLEDVYGMKFKEFKALDAGGPQTIQALKSDAIQVANLFTTDARIKAQGFVLLEHDKPIVGAENVVPIVRDDLVAAYGSKFSDVVDAVTNKLTTDGLTELNKAVDIDKEDAKTVAARWLRENDLV